jgi:hypothetical protein
VERSKKYIEAKWDVNMGGFKNKQQSKLDCKSIDGLNEKCVTGFALPFNVDSKSLGSWELRNETRDRMALDGDIMKSAKT